MKSTFLIGAILLMTILASCSSSDDPSSAAKTILETQINKGYNGYFKYIDMHKTDAVTKDVFGVKRYTIEYIAEVECVKDGGWVYFTTQDSAERIIAYGFVGDHYDQQTTNTHLVVGQKYKINGRMNLEKHEQGWVFRPQ